MKNAENSALIPLIRQDLRKNFKPYSSAAGEMGKKEDMIYLNANENPYPFQGLEGLERYDVQQPPALIHAMAETYQTKPEYIVATRGSDESIDLLIRMFCEAGKDTILTCPPTFGMYGVYGALQGAKNIEIPLVEEDHKFYLDKEAIIKAAKDPAVKLVFLCYPNSPTGNVFDAAVIEDIAKTLVNHAAIIVDEAYIDFSSAKSFITALHNHPNLLVLRTLSKIHALAGERIGGTVCADTDFMAFMRGCLAPYPLPKSVTANAVEALKQAQSKQPEMVAKIREEREKLYNAFQSFDKVEHVYPSETNFLLVKFKSYDYAQNFLKSANNAGIILRDISGKADTKNCLRISIGTAEDNAKLIELM